MLLVVIKLMPHCYCIITVSDFIKHVGRSHVPAEVNCMSKDVIIKAGKGGL